MYVYVCYSYFCRLSSKYYKDIIVLVCSCKREGNTVKIVCDIIWGGGEICIIRRVDVIFARCPNKNFKSDTCTRVFGFIWNSVLKGTS